MTAVRLHGFLDLRGEFAGRGHDEDTRAACGALRERGGHEPVQDRQHEAGRLACAGLGGGEQIAACQHVRNGLRLNGRRRRVAGVRNRTQKGISQPEVGE